MDLSASMGMTGQIGSPEVQAKIKEIEDIVIPSEKFLATVANDAQQAKTLYDKGYNMLVMMSDAIDLAKAAQRTVNTFKEYINAKMN